MADFQLLLVAGTHGNELNAPLLFAQWLENPTLVKTCNLTISKEVGNPLALKLKRRYIDTDLNRSFEPKNLLAEDFDKYEIKRAKELISKYGPNGFNPCQIAIDLHTTTSFMGGSLVIYGRRPADLALASLIQFRLGLPIYLHEDDKSQTGFLVESWPCGLVIEIGPVPQSLVDPSIVEKNRLILETCLEEISKVTTGNETYPEKLVVHSHLGSIDFPRNINNEINFCIHPELKNKDWYPIFNGSPLFLGPKGETIRFDDQAFLEAEKCSNNYAPVFINESAYAEKKIAMSITTKEILIYQEDWGKCLRKLVQL